MAVVSIHAPRAGRDPRSLCWSKEGKPCFNPRAPCGARPPCSWRTARASRFNPRAPVRGATRAGDRATPFPRGFNPRAPCGARRGRGPPSHRSSGFNPRAPCGARPGGVGLGAHALPVSIHAPRAGRDIGVGYAYADLGKFQSTRPVRGATPGRRLTLQPRDCFNPRAPCGARRHRRHGRGPAPPVSIHAPRAGRDCQFMRSHELSASIHSILKERHPHAAFSRRSITRIEDRNGANLPELPRHYRFAQAIGWLYA
ncbi:hypothetical protein HMPREF1008_00870 [Olsenella sp. oral taxon 809 str. F0356]|nr:hypothetical protein HMPREF1008_00870 [Olsenella sp. oral taxon 809 str. F0356]